MERLHRDTALTPVDTRALRAATESINGSLKGSDSWNNARLLSAYMRVQQGALDAVDAALPSIAAAADGMIKTLQSKGRNAPKGRIIYAGAGTSGRLGALDGMELGPTFDWPDDKIVFAIAEPLEIRTGTSRLGLEDNTALAEKRVRELDITPADVVIAIAASGTTPYTNRFAELARAKGACVVAIANNAKAPLLSHGTHPIYLATGAEAIAGSSRMGAGTAQKSALTLLTSLVMSKLPGIHGVHDGRMVNLRTPPNEKLRARAAEMVADLADVAIPQAAEALAHAKGDLKLAILTAGGAPLEEARAALDQTHNNLREAQKSFTRATPKRSLREHAARPPEPRTLA